MGTETLMIILVVAISLLIFLNVVVRAHAFMAMFFVAIFVAFATGIPVAKIPATLEAGVGGLMAMLAPIVTLGAIVGKMLEVSGGAERLARSLIDKLGKSKTHWAMMIIGIVCGIPVFFQVGIVLLMPLLFCVAYAAGMPLIMVGIPLVIGLLTVHCLLPPHPAAMAVVIGLHADVGKVILIGFLIGIPAAIIGGPLFGRLVKNKFELNPPSYLCVNKQTPEDQLPPFGSTLFVVLFPLLLMIANTLITMTAPQDASYLPFVSYLGNPITALFITVLVSYWFLGFKRGRTMVELTKYTEQGLLAVGPLLLIIAANGAFNNVITVSGIGVAVKNVLTSMHLNPLLLAWAVTFIMRAAIGGATPSMITAVALVSPLLSAYPSLDPAWVAAVIGAGAIGASHVNDPGFWFVKEYFGMSMVDMFKSYTLSCCIASVVALLMTLAVTSALGVI